MAGRCQGQDATNPGIVLGAAMGALAKAGRDKRSVAIELPTSHRGRGWSSSSRESTGKHGVGIVPVDGETLAEPEVYRADRVFVRLGRPTVDTEWQTDTDAILAALEAAGHPVIHIPLTGDDWVGRVRALGGRDRDRRGRPGRRSVRRALSAARV